LNSASPGLPAISIGTELAPVAIAIRAGEHGCCRFAAAADRARLAAAFVRDELWRGHRVLYLCDRGETADVIARLSALSNEIEPALARGQLEVRPARDAYFAGGTFETERMLAFIQDEHSRALADGYDGLGLTGELSHRLGEPPWFALLSEYEQRLADLLCGGSLSVFCQYDHREFAAGALSEIAETHAVDASPELAPIGRDGYLAAARIRPSETLRLSGELDFASADTLADVLAAHFHGDLRFDLADLEYVDVSGMRALRGRVGQPIHITAASASVRRLLDLLAWDTDPDVVVTA
jgi:ABC-type transporter Mla MlaB component